MDTTEEPLRKALGDMLRIGVNARDDATILMNVSNLIRRNDCLGAVEREFFVSLGEEVPDDAVSPPSWGASAPEYLRQFCKALRA